MAIKKRGRPVGSSPTKDDDYKLLQTAAYKLVRAQAKTPTEAFKQIVGEDDEASLRRLQRRWKVDGESFISEARAPFWHERWKLIEEGLKESSPETYQLIKAFESSNGGKAYLLGKGKENKPVHVMSLGLGKLSVLLKQTKMHGEQKAKEEFFKSYSKWSNFGSKPDIEFLRTFAELCLAKADEVEAAKSIKERGGKS